MKAINHYVVVDKVKTEPKKVAGKRARKGFHTSHRTKMEACLSFKRYVETDKIRIKSKALLSEIKNFVAKGNSFAAKPGEHDDLVMSFLLCIRMVDYIATFEDEVYDIINSNLGNPNNADYWYDENDDDGPLPIGIL